MGRLRVGGVLGPQELRDLARAFATARGLRRFLHARRAACPALFEACTTDATLDDVADEILAAFDPDGTLSDRASPRLKELRAEYQASRARMLSRLEELMNRYEAILQDRFVTEREGRYVIPVRSDSHERFPGIVHATSSSGATLFVEPRAVIPMGNRLKVLEAEVTREEVQVYTRLSSLAADHLPSAEACAVALARADVRGATATLARDLSLAFPVVVDEPRLELLSARHPLLLLDGIDVVASDLSIAKGHAMVVSGPNAGGKTVALKTMGLVALMIRAGLPAPCHPDSTVGIFDIVLTDVGDDQSLHQNLSTFSAHVRNLGSILGDTQPGALVLLDELAGGTDPREGEALAAGVLDSLCARGGAAIATTHYEGLKALALADDRFMNASVGFDLTTMHPTFKVAMGVPGTSSALAVAARFGLPATVIERATRFLSREDKNFEGVVQKLHEERAALELAREAAKQREREAEEMRARLDSEIERAKDREQKMLSREAEAILEGVRRAREDLRSAQARLRSKRLDEASLREASRVLDRVAADVAIGGPLEPFTLKGPAPAGHGAAPTELKRGMKVFVPRLRAEAEVVELNGDTVRVAAGPLKLTVNTSELRAVEAVEPPPSRRGKAGAPIGGRPGPEVPIPTSDNSVDLRGMRTEDALSLATTFLDRSLNEGRRVAFLIHGHGTGAIREALRKELKTSPYVATFRAGESSEGGDGVTVVWLT
jgi:DNA mismatch repair protein MutS2